MVINKSEKRLNHRGPVYIVVATQFFLCNLGNVGVTTIVGFENTACNNNLAATEVVVV